MGLTPFRGLGHSTGSKREPLLTRKLNYTGERGQNKNPKKQKTKNQKKPPPKTNNKQTRNREVVRSKRENTHKALRIMLGMW